MAKSNDFFIKKAKIVHGDKFIYTEVDYKGKRQNVKIICKKHGEFFQIAENHTRNGYSCGCHKCDLDELEIKRVNKLEKFLFDALKIHNDKYQYNKAGFKGLTSKIKIVCPIHSYFYQKPSLHLLCVNGGACPSCSRQKSSQEDWIFSFLSKNEIIFDHRVNNLIYPKEIDFYSSSLSFAVECNGLLWHSEFPYTGNGKDSLYHLDKTIKCKEKGVESFHFIEKDIKFKSKIVKSSLNRYLGINKLKLNFNKCEVKEVSEEIKSKFLDKYEINGNSKSNLNLGIFYKKRLVCIAAFLQYKSGRLKLVRSSEMFKFHVENWFYELEKVLKASYSCNKIQVKLNNNWPRSDIPTSSLNKIETFPPKCHYHNNKVRANTKFLSEAQFIQKLTKVGKYDKLLTVAENCVNNKWNRIWDTGSTIYEKHL